MSANKRFWYAKTATHCHKCNGRGWVRFGYNEGDCFKCKGTGSVQTRQLRYAPDVSEAEKVAIQKDEMERLANNRAKAADRKERKFQQFVDATPGLAEAFKFNHRILADLEYKARTYGNLSPKQVALALKIADDEANREQRRADRQAQWAAEAAARTAIPASLTEGRVEITGTVKAIRKGGEWGPQMVIADDRGFELKGGVPSSFFDGDKLHVAEGDRVSMMCRIQVHKKDNTFGFIKRPTKAQIHKPAPAKTLDNTVIGCQAGVTVRVRAAKADAGRKVSTREVIAMLAQAIKDENQSLCQLRFPALEDMGLPASSRKHSAWWSKGNAAGQVLQAHGLQASLCDGFVEIMAA